MQKKIIIISSGHPSMDERIFWKFGLTLAGNGYEVQITTSCEELNIVKENITILSFYGNNISKKEKINRFFSIIKEFDADLVICCEPLPILAAHKFRKIKRSCKIISDITEWYPFQSHFVDSKGIKRVLKYWSYFLFNVYATNLADHLIIGEELKAKLYKIISPFKRRTIIGYYAPKRFFKYYAVVPKQKEICICFCGSFIIERGFERIIELTKLLGQNFPEVRINLLLVGRFENKNDQQSFYKNEFPPNVSVVIKNWTSYDSYNSQFAEADICIDLRSKTNMRNKSIPIKVFDYMASGKPVIFPAFDSFTQLPEFNTFGHLVELDNYDSMLSIINNYLTHPEMLVKHSQAARKLFEDKYNWELVEPVFLNAIEDLIQA